MLDSTNGNLVEARSKCFSDLVVHAGKVKRPIGVMIGNILQCLTLPKVVLAKVDERGCALVQRGEMPLGQLIMHNREEH